MSAITSKFSNTKAVSVKQLFQHKTPFKVPRFQRNYAWNDDKVKALWDDMMYTFQNIENEIEHKSDAEYLLGPVVLVNNNGKELLVIDGQQRLSTLTILFCVIRDIMIEYDEKDGLNKVNELIKNESMGKQLSWKLELNAIDKDLFLEIQEYENNGDTQFERFKKAKYKSPSNKLLSSNYIYLYEAIIKFLDKFWNPDKLSVSDVEKYQNRKKHIPQLGYFVDFICDYHYVVMVVVNDDNTAFQIFETLNDRGQTLSKSNLIKNHVMNKINNKNRDLQNELSSKWDAIFDEITGQDQKDDDFIQESIRSRYLNTNSNEDKTKSLYNSGHINEKIHPKEIYQKIKDQFNHEKDTKFDNEIMCKKYIKFLDEDASFISTLNDPSLYSDDNTKDEIYTIKLLKATFIRSPILAAYRKWGHSKDYQILVKLLVKFFFKFRTVRQMHPGKIEDLVIYDITSMINAGKPLDEVINKILEHDDHEDFRYNFLKLITKPGKNIAKYVLREITIYLGTKYDDVRPIDTLTLEHILPQHFEKHWSDFLDGKGKTEEYVNRLGNLTLLHEAINSKIRNNSFLDKRNALNENDGKPMGYKASQLKINTETVCNQIEWTPDVILAREKLFAEFADKIWDLSSYKS